jgi:hypothetical protein
LYFQSAFVPGRQVSNAATTQMRFRYMQRLDLEFLVLQFILSAELKKFFLLLGILVLNNSYYGILSSTNKCNTRG